MTLPQIQMTGNCVADAELRFTPGGKAVAKVRVACNSRVKRDGGWADGETCFLDVTAWEQLAEGLAEVGTKGTKLVITGRLAQRTYTTSTGEQRTVYEVTAEEIGRSVFLQRKKAEPAQAQDPWGSWGEGNAGGQQSQHDEPPF